MSILHFPDSPNPGSRVPGGPPGAVFGFDGLVHDDTCVSETWAADVWGRVAELIPEASLTKSPHVRGLTGLVTWAWYEWDTHIPPFGFEVTDALTDLSIRGHGRGSPPTSWDFGDGSVGGAVAYQFEDAPGAAGSEGDPQARHTYETSHADAGLAEGYPFGVGVTWVDKFRSWDGAGWSGVEPMVSEAVLSDVISYPVPEVRSVLRTAPREPNPKVRVLNGRGRRWLSRGRFRSQRLRPASGLRTDRGVRNARQRARRRRGWRRPSIRRGQPDSRRVQ